MKSIQLLTIMVNTIRFLSLTVLYCIDALEFNHLVVMDGYAQTFSFINNSQQVLYENLFPFVCLFLQDKFLEVRWLGQRTAMYALKRW